MIEIILNKRDVIYIEIYNEERQILILRTIANLYHRDKLRNIMLFLWFLYM
jgi:hypothetical protein